MPNLTLRFASQIVRHVSCAEHQTITEKMSAMNTLLSFCIFIATPVTKH